MVVTQHRNQQLQRSVVEPKRWHGKRAIYFDPKNVSDCLVVPQIKKKSSQSKIHRTDDIICRRCDLYLRYDRDTRAAERSRC